jgi:hypothetical protein
VTIGGISLTGCLGLNSYDAEANANDDGAGTEAEDSDGATSNQAHGGGSGSHESRRGSRDDIDGTTDRGSGKDSSEARDGRRDDIRDGRRDDVLDRARESVDDENANDGAPRPPARVRPGSDPEDIGTSRITVVWQASPDIDTYRIYVNGEPRKTVTDQTVASIVDLNPDTTYDLQVAAVKNGTERRSSTMSVRTEPDPAEDGTGSDGDADSGGSDGGGGNRDGSNDLQEPTNVHVARSLFTETVSQTYVVIAWEGSPDTSTYRIYVDGELHRRSSGSTVTVVRDLFPGRTYEIQVAAVKDGTEVRSDSISVQTDNFFE